MILGMGTAVIAEAIAIEAFGAGVQGIFGFGVNLVTAPLLELVDPRFVPVPIILAGLVSGILVALRERGATDRRGVAWAMGGRVPGTVFGTLIVLAAPLVALRLAVAGVVLLAVALSLFGWRVHMTPGALIGTGVASGVMGTIAGLGGTPMGLLYQDAQGPAMRATLARYAVLGAGLSLAALAMVGRIGVSQLTLTMPLLPGVAVGYLYSGRLRPFLDRGSRLRAAILVFVALASLTVIADTLA